MGDRLYRSRDDRMLAGVAGGLAELWGADPALIRILWALLVIFTGGIALLVYIVMAIVVPEEDEAWPAASASAPGGAPPAGAPGAPSADWPAPAGAGWAQPPGSTREAREQARLARAEARAARRAARAEHGGGTSAGMIVGGFLVLLGVFFLVRQYLPEIDFNWFWPLILVGVGVLLLLSSIGRGPRSGGPT